MDPSPTAVVSTKPLTSGTRDIETVEAPKHEFHGKGQVEIEPYDPCIHAEEQPSFSKGVCRLVKSFQDSSDPPLTRDEALAFSVSDLGFNSHFPLVDGDSMYLNMLMDETEVDDLTEEEFSDSESSHQVRSVSRLKGDGHVPESIGHLSDMAKCENSWPVSSKDLESIKCCIDERVHQLSSDLENQRLMEIFGTHYGNKGLTTLLKEDMPPLHKDWHPPLSLSWECPVMQVNSLDSFQTGKDYDDRSV